MRPLRLDITGNTDANGNASIPVKFAQTGEWHDAKFSLSLPAPAEWAILISGRPATYGRGRRVTLGPELIMDGERVTVSVAGALPNAAIDGTAMGKSGSPDEIMASYTPAPNTIALDSLATIREIDRFTQAPNNVTTNKLYVLPVGTQSVRLEVNENGQTVSFTNLKIVGATTGDVYVFPSSASGTTGGFDNWMKPSPADVTGGILFSLDTTGSANGVQVIITADLGANFVEANLVGNGTATGSALLVQNTTAAPWQQVNTSAGNGTGTIANGGTLSLLAGQVGKTTYLFEVKYTIVAVAGSFIDIADTGNNELGRIDGSFTHSDKFTFYGKNLGVNTGVKAVNNSGVGSGAFNFGIQANQS